jgi:ureidoacrylate peracid hydrolase
MSASPVPDRLDQRSALLLVDLQNDFVHPDGAYGRAGIANADIAELGGRLAPVVAAARAAKIPVLSSRFTLVPGRDGVPIVSSHLASLRRFLGPGDFLAGSWGHQMIDELGQDDGYVEKIAYSAFAHTRLEWMLHKFAIDHLFVAGIVTNGGVASTVRDAHVREFGVTVVHDGCAAFSRAVHDATIASLGSVVGTTDCATLKSAFDGAGFERGPAR